MNILSIAGFAAITPDTSASRSLYRDRMGISFKQQNDYIYNEDLPGAHHFGVWPLIEAARACFGTDDWPSDLPVPQATLEYELESVAAVDAAVAELKASGQTFIHDARTEPWGQTLARFLSPEGLLIGLSYAPWLHEKESQS